MSWEWENELLSSYSTSTKDTFVSVTRAARSDIQILLATHYANHTNTDWRSDSGGVFHYTCCNLPISCDEKYLFRTFTITKLMQNQETKKTPTYRIASSWPLSKVFHFFNKVVTSNIWENWEPVHVRARLWDRRPRCQNVTAGWHTIRYDALCCDTILAAE